MADGHTWLSAGGIEPQPDAVEKGWLPEGFAMHTRHCVRCGAVETWKRDSADDEWILASNSPGIALREAHGPCGRKT